MTDQPPSPAAPTSGPYYVWLPRGADQGCRAIRTEKGRSQGSYQGTEIAYTVGLGDDAEDEANANLLAASWETAAERDRLVKDRDSWKMLACSSNARCDRLVVENKGLIALVDESLAFVAVWAATYQHTHDLADIHPKHQETIDKIRAALAEAHKP